MGMTVNNNVAAFNAYRNLSTAQANMSQSLQRLSSGNRINTAADDASGLVTSEQLRATIGGLQSATVNAQDGTNVVQTADGALNEVSTILQRMRALTMNAAGDGASSTTAVAADQAEFKSLTTEVDRIAKNTSFAGTNLLDGTYNRNFALSSDLSSNSINNVKIGVFNAAGSASGVAGDASFTSANLGSVGTGTAGTYKVAAPGSFDYSGANAAQVSFSDGHNGAVVTLNKNDSTAAGLVSDLNTQFQAQGGNFAAAVGTGADAGKIVVTQSNDTGGTVATSDLTGTSNLTGGTAVAGAAGTGSLALSSIDLTHLSGSGSGANELSAIDAAISQVSQARGALGAQQNTFQHVINNLQVTQQNLTSSDSRIRNTDMASEMTNFTQQQVLVQAGTAMLAQANQMPQSILKLLG